LFDVDVVQKTLQGKNFSNVPSPLDFGKQHKFYSAIKNLFHSLSLPPLPGILQGFKLFGKYSELK